MELGLQMAIVVPLFAARGSSHPENEQAHTRARSLTSQIGESPELPRVLTGMADAYLVKGDLATSAEVATEALAASERTGRSGWNIQSVWRTRSSLPAVSISSNT